MTPRPFVSPAPGAEAVAAAEVLGDYGAEIIKIENPANPDAIRSWGVVEDRGIHPFWAVFGRNKLPVTLNLKDPDGLGVFLKLVEGADVVVVSYGITSRVARMGVELARKKGIKVGVMRLEIVWPFPEKRIRELSEKIKAFVVPEINYGQIVLEVERCAAGRAAAVLVPHGGGGVHDPEDIWGSQLAVAREVLDIAREHGHREHRRLLRAARLRPARPAGRPPRRSRACQLRPKLRPSPPN